MWGQGGKSSCQARYVPINKCAQISKSCQSIWIPQRVLESSSKFTLDGYSRITLLEVSKNRKCKAYNVFYAKSENFTNVSITQELLNGIEIRKEFWNAHQNSNKMDMVALFY